MSFKFFFLCLFLTNTNFYVALTALGIVDTTPGEFPYVAYIQTNLWRYCPAALITETHLLTLAYYVQDASYVKVYVGTRRQPNLLGYVREEYTQIYNTSHVYIHEEFVERTNPKHSINNIAVIKLEQPVVINNYVRPGKLISIDPNTLNGKHLAQVLGWWYIDNTVMQAETVELLNQTACSSSYLFKPYFLKNQELCTLSGSQERLYRMGNVLSVHNKIAGFQVERYYDCNDGNDMDISSKCYHAQVFLNIAPFLPWISQKTGVSVEQLTASNLNLDRPFVNRVVDNRIDGGGAFP